VQNGGEKVDAFVRNTMKSHLFVAGQIGMKFAKNVNKCALLNLKQVSK